MGRNLFFNFLVKMSRFSPPKLPMTQAGRLEGKFLCPRHAPSKQEKRKLGTFFSY